MKVMNSKKIKWLSTAGTVCTLLVILLAFFVLQGSDLEIQASADGSGVIITPPSPSQVSLDPLTIPKFAQELAVPPTVVPKVIKDAHGKVIRHEVTMSVDYIRQQVLPPPFPQTTLLGYGTNVRFPGSSVTQFAFVSPGPTFENTRHIPLRLTFRNVLKQPNIMPVDPTVHWANPNAFEAPVPPFVPFPPGYEAAQFPMAHVTHTHGLVVAPQFDGTADEWFTAFGQFGPSFVSQTYEQPIDQPSTQLFYHDHAMGTTRLDVYLGLVAPGYFIRDPNNPLDKPTSPLPKGEFEIPLAVHDRQFFTDGELAFPRVGINPANPYWQPGDGANTVLVNGKVWPNLNVKRQQYRFRLLAAGNGRLWTFQFTNAGTPVPFTIIGSDGGYLPAPQVVTQVILGITERADVLFDFSQFAPGTQIIMINAGANPDTVGTVMRFTVQDTAVVTPPVLNPALFPARPALPTDAPLRTKSLHVLTDAQGNVTVNLDALEFSSPPSEFPLVGSTEEWKFVNTAGVSHEIHLHLIEFQVLERQAINTPAYLAQWNILNGFRPVTRPIVLDPTPFLTGDPIPPLPYETGWKDTVRTPGNQVTRIIARWAPQEVATGGVAPGQNKFPIDPQFPPEVDPYTGPGYMWHCHILGHEDHDMMRPLPIVNLWKANERYPLGRVVTFQNINYRARKAHTSTTQTPNNRFDLWERVNNNDGTWQPQIIYAIGDRVLFNSQLYRALHVHQAQAGQTPAIRTDLWESLPMTACEQLVFFTEHHLGTDPRAQQFFDIGQAGDETACTAALPAALAIFEHTHATPASGLCENPVVITVPDGQTFTSDPDVTCYETESWILKIIVPRLLTGQKVIVNGRELKVGVNYPLPPQRNHGYAIQTVGGAIFIADSGNAGVPADCTCPAGCETRTTITVPFTKEGAGEFCYETTNLGTYINSWELVSLNINGTEYANRYVPSSSIPAINGKYYIYYKGNFGWSHLEIKN